MLEIFGVPISVHTRKVLVTANAKGLEYRNEPVIPFDPPADWSSLSPTGLIPAISHEGYTLADSAAICAYLERLHPGPPVYPADPRDLGKALWLEQYGTGVLFREVVHPLFLQKVIRPNILRAGPPDEAEIARVAQEVAPGVFDYLESQAEGAFMVGGSFGIADITLACNLLNYHYLGFRLDAGRHAKLADIFARTLAMPPFQRALQAEAPFVEKMGLDGAFLRQAA
jgi:glutathione S-transferase